MKKLFLRLVLITIVAAAAPAAYAVEYAQIQVSKSSISFTYKQMNVAMAGKFKKFTGQLRFDPQQATKAMASFDIDLNSIDTGAADADTEVTGKSWFNTTAFPAAHFESGSVKAVGGNRYDVAGKLSIKGQTRDIIVPATLIEQGKVAVFDGSFTIRRGDFSIGEGAWAKFDIVANDIVVKFRFTALPGK